MANTTYIDLFAGAGGWSVGFEAAGLDHVGMYDFNESACKTAESNFGDLVTCCDLSSFSPDSFPEVDVIVGSPPCQGFSNEGKKNPNDPRNSLVWSFFDIIEQRKPAVWVFENVPGFQRSYGGRYYKDLMERLDESPYQTASMIVNAADYGVPQARKRFVMIGALDFKPQIPVPTHTAEPDLLTLYPHVTLWDAIGDLPVPQLGDRVGEFEYPEKRLSDYQRVMRRGSEKVYNHTAQNHSARVLEKIKNVPLRGDMRSFSESYEENAVHYCGGYRRAVKDEPSWTAYWTRGMTSIHPEQHRFLTPRECARIQSFPDRFRFQGSTIENYTQVCNAVPPLLAEAVASYIEGELSGKAVKTPNLQETQ